MNYRQSHKMDTISNLNFCFRYAVTISAFNSAGSGPFSLPVYQDTMEGGNKSWTNFSVLLSNLHINIIYEWGFSFSLYDILTSEFPIPQFVAPEHAPASVECTAVSSTSLRVGWQPIAIHGQGSSLIGYSILYATEGRTLLVLSPLMLVVPL